MVVRVPTWPENRELKPGEIERRQQPPALLRHEPGDFDVVVAVNADDVLGSALNQAEDRADQQEGGRALPATKGVQGKDGPPRGRRQGNDGLLVAGREDRRRGDLDRLT